MDGEAIRQIRSTPPPMREACTGRLANLMAALGHQLRPSLARPASAHPTSPRRYHRWSTGIRPTHGVLPQLSSIGLKSRSPLTVPYNLLPCSRCVDGAASVHAESTSSMPSMNPRWRAPAPATMSPPSRRRVTLIRTGLIRLGCSHAVGAADRLSLRLAAALAAALMGRWLGRLSGRHLARPEGARPPPGLELLPSRAHACA